ncbi:MAG: S9 family peptidase [Candidatus Eremiobacteraeota bacterium]|nr:S9 family peptidase [Candidatus Eremiobacteraeota bacterium]
MTARGQLTPEHLYTLPVVSGCALDRSARRVAYLRTTVAEAANAYRGSIRVYDLETAATTPFTHATARDTSPQWSADGSKLFFLSDRSGSMQLWCIELAGGDAYLLRALDGSVTDYAPSPDGRHVAAIVVPALGKNEVDARGWRRITRQRYRADGIGYHDSYPQIWLIDLQEGTTRALTDANGFVAAPSWSSDGAWLAYAADHGADADGVALRELWVHAVHGQSGPRKLLTLRGAVQTPAWSPDAQRIAFIGSDDLRGGYGMLNQRLFAVAPDVGEPICLTPSEEWTCGDLTITDTGAAGTPFAPRFMQGGDIALLGTQNGATRIFIVARDLRIRTATPSSMSVSTFACGNAGSFVCCASGGVIPPELYEISASGVPRRLTTETKQWCDAAELHEPVRLSVETPSGTIDAWHIAADVRTPRPCVVQIHGGPHFAYGEAFFFEFQLLAAHGYDVLYCNPRGSQGYGEAFAAAIVGKWGGPALADCIAALDALVTQGGTDERRIGIAGGSYGGYLTAWAIGHSKRFAAAVAMRAAVNLESLWGTSEVGRFLDVELGGTPAQVPDVYRRNSPLTYANEITTPLLLIHGERDFRCPIEQAEQLFSALYQQNKKVEFMRFTEADHGLSRTGPPRQRAARLHAILDWFDRYLT